MQRWTRSLVLLVAPALLLSVAMLGCSGGGDKDKKPAEKAKKGEKPSTDEANKEKGTGDETPAGEKKAVKGNGTTTITGTVTFTGDMDALKMEVKKLDENLLKDIDKASSEKEMCLAATAKPGEKTEYQWHVNQENKGVANVIVWIRPASDDEYFDVSDLVKKGEGFDKEIKLNQPHCAFIPHAFTLFQRYVDPKKPGQPVAKLPTTGQKFEVTNAAPKGHNTQWSGPGTKGGNEVVQPKTETPITNILPSYKGPVTFSCKIHPWMRAYAWSFDHPFAAVTDKDGKFEIKNVPAGVKVKIVAWHEEAPGNFLNAGGAAGEAFEIKAKDSKTTKDFAIKSIK